MLRVLLSSLVLFAAVAPAASAAEPGHAPGDVHSDLLVDTKAFFDRNHLLVLAAGAVLSAAAYEYEDPDTAADLLGHGVIDPIADAGNIWGDARVLLPLSLGVWAAGGAFDDDRLARTGYEAARGLAWTYLFTGLLKHAVDRTRPNGDSLSFPSGHTAGAFTVAAVVGRRYGGWPEVATLALAVITGAGRMEDRKHFASDVVAGAAIGWIAGRTTSGSRNGEASPYALTPLGSGLSFSFAF